MATDTRVAAQFGNAIAQGDFAAAHALLAKGAQQLYSPDDLKRSVERMIAIGDGPIDHVEVMSDFILEDWPAKQDGDVATVYVALDGDGFCEAVTVTLTHDAGDIRIRHLEWGRP